MTITHKFARLSLLATALVYAVIAIVTATVVIPAVKSDTFALADPDRAATAFLVNSLLFLLIVVALVLISRRVANSGMKAGLIALGILALLLTLALLDAAAAFTGHGPGMHTTVIVLFICVGLGLVASIFLIATAFLRRQSPNVQKEQSAS